MFPMCNNVPNVQHFFGELRCCTLEYNRCICFVKWSWIHNLLSTICYIQFCSLTTNSLSDSFTILWIDPLLIHYRFCDFSMNRLSALRIDNESTISSRIHYIICVPIIDLLFISRMNFESTNFWAFLLIIYYLLHLFKINPPFANL